MFEDDEVEAIVAEVTAEEVTVGGKEGPEEYYGRGEGGGEGEEFGFKRGNGWGAW